MTIPVRPGIRPDTIVETLSKIAPEHARHALRSFDAIDRIGPHARAYMREVLLSDDFERHCSRLPLRALARLSFDELSKVVHSGGWMQDDVRTLYEPKPDTDHSPHELVGKISNSIWRWGHGERDWNELVDCWNGLRSLDLAIPGFDVEIDHTIWHHSRGVSKYSQTYIDGCFALLVRHQGRHVMTVGFSFGAHRRLLVQQIQAVSPKGNRWMFRFPANRVEHVLDRFAAAFPHHAIHLADGASVARSILGNYDSSIKRNASFIAKMRTWIDQTKCDDSRAFYVKSIADTEGEGIALRSKHDALACDADRLARLYDATGRYRRGDLYETNGLSHHRMETDGAGRALAA